MCSVALKKRYRFILAYTASRKPDGMVLLSGNYEPQKQAVLPNDHFLGINIEFSMEH